VRDLAPACTTGTGALLALAGTGTGTGTHGAPYFLCESKNLNL